MTLTTTRIAIKKNTIKKDIFGYSRFARVRRRRRINRIFVN